MHLEFYLATHSTDIILSKSIKALPLSSRFCKITGTYNLKVPSSLEQVHRFYSSEGCYSIFFCVCVCVFWIWFFQDRVSLYSPGCPTTHSVDQAGLKLRNLPTFTSHSPGINGVCHHHQAGLQFFNHYFSVWYNISGNEVNRTLNVVIFFSKYIL